METDAELLQRYAEQDDQVAFGELVSRKLRLVHSAAHLRTGGSPELAEEVTQKVFIDLARKSRVLCHHACLEGWLFTATQYAAKDVIKQRIRQERLAERMTLMSELDGPEETIHWEQLRPVLQSFLDKLGEKDRVAVVMRYLEGRSHAEIGCRLGMGENAARMRVERSVEKLRVVLRKKGLVSTREALVAVLGASAAVAAPAGLSDSIGAAVLAAGKAPGLASALFAMITLKTLIVGGTAGAALAVGSVAYLHAQDTKGPEVLSSAKPVAAEVAATDKTAQEVSNAVGELQRKAATPVAAETLAARREAAYKTYGVNPAIPWVNEGQATPQAALMTFAWASVEGDLDVLEKVVCFDGSGREKAEAIRASLPESVRKEFPTPERLLALCLAADAKDYGPPPADGLRKAKLFQLSPERVSFGKPEDQKGDHEYVKTEQGWKYVMPEKAVVQYLQYHLTHAH